ncbi:zinc ABC transporter substrate-binding protein [Pseudahrensia aquimaris]|uniref:High-affinity zinc uptake system protein ZnuA n=1 Tax=Pseudahrensia aquimaris TaxID=744461 RepID=A0ABW3FHX0_9HYPH
MSRSSLFALVATFLAATLAQAFAAPKVVTTIRPLHSIVANVMGDVGSPVLLLDGATSPHTATFKPSQAQFLQDADAVFWIGPVMETFLANSLDTIPQNAVVKEMMEAKGVTTLPLRGKHDHDHDHSHSKKKHDHDHDHDDHTKGNDDLSEETLDGHIWLDPQNAAAMALAIAETLAEKDAANAETYRANAKTFAASLKPLSEEVAALLKEVSGQTYFVQHDAYQYFEKRFGLAQPVPVSINPQTRPGAASVRALRERMAQAEQPCLLSEPQLGSALADSLVADSGGRLGVVDPLGQNHEPGPALYAALLRDMAASFKACVDGS